MKNRNNSRTCRVIQIFLVIIIPCVAQAQSTRPAADPVTVAETKAMRERRYADAEKILVDAIQAAEQTEPESPRLAGYLKRLAQLLLMKDQFTEAVTLWQRALEIDRRALGPRDMNVANDLTSIASLLRTRGRNDEAEQLLTQALEITDLNASHFGSAKDAEAAAIVFVTLGDLYVSEQRWTEAEPLLLEGKKLCDLLRNPAGACERIAHNLGEVYRAEGKAADADHSASDPGAFPAEVASLNEEGKRYLAEGMYPQAEDVYKRAISWIQKNPQPTFPDLYSVELNSLGQALEKQRRNDEAERNYLSAIEWKESTAGPKPPASLGIQYFDFSYLLNLYRTEGRLADLDPVVSRVLETQQRFLDPQNAGIAQTLLTLANLYKEQGDKDEKWYAEAVPIAEHALGIQQKNLGPDHPLLLPALYSYAEILAKVHEDAKAAEVRARMSAIRKKVQQGRGN